MFIVLIVFVLAVLLLFKVEPYSNHNEMLISEKLPPPFDVLYLETGKLTRILQQDQNHGQIRLLLDNYIIELKPKFEKCDTYKKKGLYCYQIDQIVQGLIQIVTDFHKHYSLSDLVQRSNMLQKKTWEFGIQNSL